MYLPSKTEDLVESKPAPDETGQVLLKAAQLLRERGHTKNILVDDELRMCAHGAILVALHPDADPHGMIATGFSAPEIRLARFLKSHGAEYVYTETAVGSEFGNSALWNNLPERTADEVIDAMEGAACWREPVPA